MSITLRVRSYLFAGASVLAMAASAAPSLAADAPSAQDSQVIEEVVVTATGREARLQDVPIAITAVTAETVKNAGITDLRSVQQIAPSFKFYTGQSNAAGTTASIRGIGTGGDNPGFESAVGFFIDGVYRNRSGVALSELPEVSRIEVLRGPQGTLFGRNTTAGAISVTTKGPEFSPRGFAIVSVGDYNYKSATFGITGPLIADKLAGRLEGNIQKRDGYITDVTSNRDINNRDRWNLRGQLLWNFDEGSLRVIADTSATNEQCCSAVTSKLGSFAPAINFVAGLNNLTGILPADPSARRTTISPNRDLAEKVKESGISAEYNRTFGGVKFTSVTAYRDWKALRNQDIDFSAMDRAYRDGYRDGFKTFTQEVRFQGDMGKLNWLAGAFFADEKLNHVDKIRFGADGARYVDALAAGVDLNGAAPGGTGFNLFGSLGTAGCGPASALYANCRILEAALAGSPAAPFASAYAEAVAAGAPVPGTGQNSDQFQTHTRSFSVFTHNEYALTDKLTLTAGVRWNHETKDVTANLDSTAPGCSALTANPFYTGASQALLASPLAGFLLFVCNPVVNTVANGSYSDGTEENEWTGTASLSYKLSDDVMYYGGFSHGYKAGGYNLDRSGFNISPATTVKPSISETHFNPEFIDAYELGVKSSLFSGITTLNLNLFYQEVSDFQLNAFSGFNFVTRNVPKLISRGVELDSVTKPMPGLTIQAGALYDEAYFDSPVTFGTQTIRSGDKLAGQPKWTVTSAVTYKRPIPGTQLDGLVFVDGRYNSAYATQNLSRDPSGSTDNKAYAIFNARIGVGDQAGRWNAELFIRNLADKYYTIGGFAVPEQTGNYAVYPGEPRTYGATVRVNF
jgi:outer membrane receptor protein involved in Fe transport